MLKIVATSMLIVAAAACDQAKLVACGTVVPGPDTSPCDAMNNLLKCAGDAGCLTEELCNQYDAMSAAIPNCDLKCTVPGCFPASSTVELENGQTKYMDQVTVGDKVRVGPKEFSEVYFFSTNMADVSAKFVKIIVDEGADLSLTSGHFLYANGKQVQAGDVKVGDTVMLGNGTSAAVTAIEAKWGSGLFNPHTLHGDIVVDGVKTTTYTAAVHPKLAHAILSPLRVMYSAGAVFGSGFEGLIKGLPSWVLKAVSA